jgi:DNA-binding Xre family transcriptional regulator
MEHSTYLKGIKSALRSRDVQYSDLAEKLKMTESGVKKMLNAKDISLRRVLQICEILQVLPGQLFAASEDSVIPTLYLTDKQESTLLENRLLLMIYWLFTIEKLSPEEIVTKHHLSEAELKKSLQRLVSLDLVSQLRGKFFPKHQGKFRWPENSRLVRTLNHEWSQLTLKRALKTESSKNLRLVALKLSNESYERFLSRLSELFDETVQISEREGLASGHQNLCDVTALFAAVDRGVFA